MPPAAEALPPCLPRLPRLRPLLLLLALAALSAADPLPPLPWASPGPVLGVLLKGGLGNQLFMYAGGYGTARAAGHPPQAFYVSCFRPKMHGASRQAYRPPFPLEGLARSHVVNCTGKKGYHKSACKNLRCMPRRGAIVADRTRHAGSYLKHNTQVVEEARRARERGDDAMLFGAMHHEGYFREHAGEVRELFREPAYVEAELDVELQQKGLPGVVRAGDLEGKYFIHVRIFASGDDTRHNFDLSSYFDRAIKYVKARDPGAEFVVFTNRLDQLEKAYPSLTSFPAFVGGDPVVSLYAMARCKGGVASNSTYSWWAAWLIRPRPYLSGGGAGAGAEEGGGGKIVVLPNRFFTEALDQTGGYLNMTGAVILPV